MCAYLLSVGDELVSGLTIDTNSAWLAQHLTSLGISIIAHVTVGDDLTPIVSAIKHALAALRQDGDGQSTLLLITGGLGPTEDDLTRQALAAALDEQLVEDPDAVLQLENWFKSRGRQMSPSNRTQALRPSSATCIENTTGTAPGLRVRKAETEIVAMPGVPREMREMFTRSVLPPLREKAGDEVTVLAKLNTFGMGESIIGERIKDLMVRGANPAVGTTVNDGIVSVRIYSTGPLAQAQANTQRVRQTLMERLPAVIFGENDETIEMAVATLLRTARYTVATAESCTGGLLAKLLTDMPGSSAYFLRGWVTYSNRAKHQDLAVPEALIETHGAVSEPVVRAMAEGARKSADSNYALAITGIAGPDGGSAEKPVGSVWIGLAGPDLGLDGEATSARKFVFPGDRAAIRLRAAQMALSLLRWKLLGQNVPV